MHLPVDGSIVNINDNRVDYAFGPDAWQLKGDGLGGTFFSFLTVSNGHVDLQNRLAQAGIEVPVSCFYTSAMATADFLKRQTGRKAYVIGEGALTDAPQLDVGGLFAVREVRVAVAQLLRQVELEPLRELDRTRDRVEVVREALGHLSGP